MLGLMGPMIVRVVVTAQPCNVGGMTSIGPMSLPDSSIDQQKLVC